VDAVFRIRSLGTATTGLSDQYADGKAAKVWALYIGDISRRTDNYRLETNGSIQFSLHKNVLKNLQIQVFFRKLMSKYLAG
jgi:hypothetical protein